MYKTFKAYECLRRALVRYKRDRFTALGGRKKENINCFTKLKGEFFFSLLIEYGKQNVHRTSL